MIGFRRYRRMRDGGGDISQFVVVTRRILFLILAIASPVYAADPVQPEANPAGSAKLLHAFVSNKTDGKPTKKFFTNAAKIYGIWQGDALHAGDIIQAVWVAESFGYSRKDVKITHGETTAYKPDDYGIFSLARPVAGWPVGRYRLELYVGSKLADTVRFTIEQDVTVEVQ